MVAPIFPDLLLWDLGGPYYLCSWPHCLKVVRVYDPNKQDDRYLRTSDYPSKEEA